MMEWTFTAGRRRQLGEARQDRRSPLQLVDAGRHGLAEMIPEECPARCATPAGDGPPARGPGRGPTACRRAGSAPGRNGCPGAAWRCRSPGGPPAAPRRTGRCGRGRRSSFSPGSSPNGRSLTTRQRRSPASAAIIFESRPPMLWPTIDHPIEAASDLSGSSFRRRPRPGSSSAGRPSTGSGRPSSSRTSRTGIAP